LFLVSLLLMTGYRTGNEREDVSLEIRFDAAGVVFEGRQVLQPLSLTLTERRIGVIGLNGSGKTTFARLINGLNKPSEGKVSVNGLDTVSDARAILQMVGFIFQNPQNQIILPIVRDDVAFGLKRLGLGKAETENRVKVVLAGLGIAQLEDRRAHELSGGELQLAALAALLVTEPQILILDEPTNQLDLKNRAVVERTMAALSQALIVITHDLPLLRGFDRVLVFHEGALIADAAPEEAVARYLEVASR
jgi:biotin transport system ATP-binding protein